MEQKRIIFLSGDMDLGGAAIFVMNVCGAINQLNTKWHARAGVFTHLGIVGQQMLDHGAEILGPFPKAIIHEDYIEAMHARCSEIKPDIIVANLGGVAFDFLRFVPGEVLRIAMIHSDDECVYQQIERYLPWIDLVVGVSAMNCERMRQRLKNTSVPCTQISCGVPMSQEVSRDLEPGKPLRILYLGRISNEQKRVNIMTEVIRKTIDMNLHVSWTIAGDGPQLHEMKSSLSSYHGKVKFKDHVPYHEVSELLSEHDVYFLCSDYEGLPLSMLEAMGAGCVPIVSDLPSGISEVVNESNGIRVPIHKPEDFVDAIVRLANDRSLLKIMSEQARLSVEDYYSNTAMAQRWVEVLDNYSKTMAADWNMRCVGNLPTHIEKKIINIPIFRPLRRFVKSILKK